MNAAARLRFEKKLADRFSEEYCDVSVGWHGVGPEPDYATVWVRKAGTVLQMAVYPREIGRSYSAEWIIERLARQFVEEYQRFERGEGVKGYREASDGQSTESGS